MPIDYKKYPSNWKTEIRLAILKRACDCCEFCGVMNHVWIRRAKENSAVYRYWYNCIKEWVSQDTIPERFQQFTFMKPIKIILTIAHLDQDITNNDYANLAALCQRCHLGHDRRYRKNERKKP